jgi:hypothetical protein
LAETYLLKPGAAKLERWRRAAKARGYSSLASFIDAAVERQVDVSEKQPTLEFMSAGIASAAQSLPAARRAPRREPCVHRLSPASFCKVCDA